MNRSIFSRKKDAFSDIDEASYASKTMLFKERHQAFIKPSVALGVGAMSST
jgi:hypothetical protein